MPHSPSLTSSPLCLYQPASIKARRPGAFLFVRHPPPVPVKIARDGPMKIKNSLKSLKTRDRNNRIVRRKGRVYVINKQNPRYKARQG